MDTLSTKKAELEALVELHKPDVLGLSEVKPKRCRYRVQESEVKLDGYEVFHTLEEEGRGICLYVKSQLGPSPYEIKNTGGEVRAVQCQLDGGDNLLVALVYRSPGSTKEENAALNRVMEELAKSKSSHIVIMGDLNFPEINWKQNTCSRTEDHPASKFLKMTKDCYLIQHQKTVTRFREGQKSNLLDLVFTNRDDMLSEINTKAGLGKSDHFVLAFTIACQGKQEIPRVRHNYAKADFNQMNKSLGEVNWSKDLEDLDVEETWKYIKDKVTKAIDDNTPKLKVTTSTKRKGWMDKDTLETVRKKHRLFRLWRESKEEDRDQAYKKYTGARKQATRACRNAKRRMERNIATQAKRNPKAFWSYVKTKTRCRARVADLKKKDGEKTKNDEEKAETLNEFFQSVFTKENDGPLPDAPCYNTGSKLLDFEIKVDKVRKQLSSLHTGKAPGPDGITPMVLAKAADSLALPLQLLFQRSLDSGSVPDDWREAIVTPIYKKGSRSLASNYRPVSLTDSLQNNGEAGEGASDHPSAEQRLDL